MLHILNFYIVDVIFEYCMNRLMGDVPIKRSSARSADGRIEMVELRTEMR